MENTYAKALWKMVEGGMTPKQGVAKLHAYLTGRGRADLMPRIGRALARIASRERAKNTIVLSVAHEKDVASAKRGAAHVLKGLGATPDDIDIRVDESLIGGWRLLGREQLLDASFKKSLLSIYNRSTQ